MQRFPVLLLLAAVAGMPLYGQDAPQGPPLAETPADTGNIPATLIQPIERAADYLNFFAFYNGTYDSTNDYTAAGTTQGNIGQQFGGGVSATHDFAKGILSFGYRGDYRDSSYQYGSGVEQSLNFFVRRLITRRFTLSFQEVGGTYPQGTVTQEPSTSVLQQYVQTSPYSSAYKFSGSTVTAAYRETARLTYELTGTFALSRYSGNAFNYGNDDVIGTATAIYQINAKTSLSGTYQNTYFHYQRNAGSASENSGYLTVSRLFPNHWTAGFSGGISHVDSSGSYPVSVLASYNGAIVPIVFVGHYQTSSNLPYLSGSISRTTHHFLLSATGGESITPGNGVYLSARTLGVSGTVSYSTRRSNISAFGSWSKLSSATVSSSGSYLAGNFGAAYSYNLIRHVGTTLGYDHVTSYFANSNIKADDNRVTLGIYFSSKDIPLAVF